jgi:hypothetical protein
MKASSRHRWYGRAVISTPLALLCVSLSVFGGGKGASGVEDISLTVPRAVCGPNDHPESALQGQVPAYLRAAGFQGFNCNLQLIGQSKGDGANWQTAEFKDSKGHTCGYHGTSFSTVNRTHLGVPAIDVTDANNPTPTAYLTTTSMLDPWESLKVNERRQLLAADNGHNGGGGPEVDIYDLSADCRFPQLLSSIAVGTGADGGGLLDPIVGHEGAWAPDGLTYYGGDLRFNPTGSVVIGQYYAVDTTIATAPKLIGTWTIGISGTRPHGMSISDDGNRGYFVSLGTSGGPAGLTDPTIPANNGLLVYDLSDFQARTLNPQPRLISSLLWKDGSVAQHTIPVKIGGKPYIIFVDEGGSGGASSAAQEQAACAAGFPPFPMARIIDISNETNPMIVSRLMLEIHAPKSCSFVLPDLVGLSTFTYGSHYCSVDNKQNATTLACGYFNSGIRVFDIRDPLRPKEIAYYNPAGVTTASPGSNHVRPGGWVTGGPDWCSAQVHLDADRGTLWTTCQDNGLLMLKFTNNAWPLPGSATPPGQQN